MNKYKGIIVAMAVMLAWSGCFYYNITQPVAWLWAGTYVMVLVQAHLFTGLFITAHDSMHGTVAPHNARLNKYIGVVCATLFAFNDYKILYPKHHAHHKFVGTADDPDFHETENRSMWRWFWGFATEYVGIRQIVLNALVFNVLAYNFGIGNAVLYYVLAPMLGTFQLFYFGTYLPHKSAHAPDNIHKARSQSKNHLWAFVSCYFFGYHYEHHDQPYVAWWQLWRVKK